MEAIYDDIGVNYSVTRCTDPEIAEQLYSKLRGATRIVNIGAGTGSYEPEGIELVAVEPSSKMISQRKNGSHRIEQAFAEKLPFKNNSFSHAMTVNSMHHWKSRALAFDEINRVATDKFVAISWDPESDPFWLTRDYFPEIYEIDKGIFPGMEELNEHFSEVVITPLKIPADCKDGLLAAFWKRPEAYLNRKVRQSTSPFSKIKNLAEGLRKLEDDIASGAWAKNNHAILNSTSLDVGYRLISARVRDA
jgi:SAM-dependent methyltransferase